jgi:TonB family protein
MKGFVPVTVAVLSGVAFAGSAGRAQTRNEDWKRCNNVEAAKIACFTAVIDAGKSSAETQAIAYIGRAIAYASSQADNALADFAKAIALAPNNADAFRLRAGLYHDTGHDTSALAGYDQAAWLDRNAVLETHVASPANGAPGVTRVPLPYRTLPTPVTGDMITVADYPALSIRLREQGVVIVKYTVLADGDVGNCAVTISSGFPRLDDAACRAIQNHWHFIPAVEGDQFVAFPSGAHVEFVVR